MKHGHKTLASANGWRTLGIAMAIAVAFTALDNGRVLASPGDTPMGAVLCNIVGWIVFGNLGRGFATLAVIVLGVGGALGKTSWSLAITVAIGISVVFSAPTIVGLLGGGVACQ